jgi:predicted HTH transcriptional regulator
MKISELKSIIAQGEDSRLQFKLDIRNVDALAAEMVAFSNNEGGRILIGVTDAGEVKGVPRSDVGRINQIISNAASQHVRSHPGFLCRQGAAALSRIRFRDQTRP